MKNYQSRRFFIFRCFSIILIFSSILLLFFSLTLYPVAKSILGYAATDGNFERLTPSLFQQTRLFLLFFSLGGIGIGTTAFVFNKKLLQ